MSAGFGPSDPRVARAAALLEELGIRGARVSVAGHDGDVAAVEVAPDQWEATLRQGAELDRRLRALGFRYAALDLAPAPADHG